MKRNHSIERALGWPYWIGRKPSYIIPPKSVVALKKIDASWNADLAIGTQFRIGYYSRYDGPACVWLVDSQGKYDQTWDQKSILEYFEILSVSDETDTYGVNRSPLGAL